jgi:hypothetical protein
MHVGILVSDLLHDAVTWWEPNAVLVDPANDIVLEHDLNVEGHLRL